MRRFLLEIIIALSPIASRAAFGRMLGESGQRICLKEIFTSVISWFKGVLVRSTLVLLVFKLCVNKIVNIIDMGKYVKHAIMFSSFLVRFYAFCAQKLSRLT